MAAAGRWGVGNLTWHTSPMMLVRIGGKINPVT